MKLLQFIGKLKLKKLLYCFISLIFVMTILLSITASVKASQLVGIERKIYQLDEENKLLSSDLINKSSLKLTARTASESGLISQRTVIYLNHDVSIAQLR